MLSVDGTGSLGSTYQLLVTDGSHSLKIGESSSGGDIQSANSLPLYLNYAGNNVIIGNTGGSGSFGINALTSTNTFTLGYGSTGIASNNSSSSTNYERVIEQYQSNVYTIGSYCGGTGTCRSLELGLQTTAGTTTHTGGRLFSINLNPSVYTGNFNFYAYTGAAGTIITANPVLTGASVQQDMLSLQGTVFQSGTAGYTGLLVAAYEQSTGSGTDYLIDAGTNTAATGGGTHTSKFNVDHNGNTYVAGTAAVATTTIPSGYTMAVNGNVIAGSLTVQMHSLWPDYVFGSAYKLKPLSEVSMFIGQNHHLEGLPSASAVAKNGLNLGQTDLALVKKVEELTLYLVEKDKQLKAEEEQIKAQNERIDKLEKMVEGLVKGGR